MAAFEAFKGALVLVAGFGVASLIHRDVQQVAEHLVHRLHLDAAKRYPRIFLDLAANLSDAQLWALAEIARVLKPRGIAVLALPNRASAYGLAHNRCVPWSFDRELARAGLRKLQSKACNFMLFPLQELAPRFGDSQYIVKAQKTAWRSASSV